MHDEKLSRQDIKLIEQSVRWPTSKAIREACVRRMVRVIASPESSDRYAIAAVRALTAIEAQNQLDEHKVIDVGIQREHEELDRIAADLGIPVAAITNLAGQATASSVDSSGGVGAESNGAGS